MSEPTPTPETDAKLADDLARTLIHTVVCQRNAAIAERDAARAAHNDALLRLHVTTAERDALRAALDEYGEHQGVCPKKYHGMKDSRPCTCGLDEAAKEGA